MAHAIWSGAINFGLVTIPVKLFTAVRSDDLRFNFLHKKDDGRIYNERHCTVCGEKVEYADLVRGYEYEKGHYVTVSDDGVMPLFGSATSVGASAVMRPACRRHCLLRCSAASVPKGIPIASASAMAIEPSSSVTGRPCAMSSLTVKSLYLKEGPKSPCDSARR